MFRSHFIRTIVNKNAHIILLYRLFNVFERYAPFSTSSLIPIAYWNRENRRACSFTTTWSNMPTCVMHCFSPVAALSDALSAQQTQSSAAPILEHCWQAHQLRYLAYRAFLTMLSCETRGRNVRYRLPSCVLLAVRRRYPEEDGNYTGTLANHEAFILPWIWENWFAIYYFISILSQKYNVHSYWQ